MDKESICRFLKRLNANLVDIISDMKKDFQRRPPEPSTIKERLMSWKGKYSQIVSSNLKQSILTLQADEATFDFKEFLAKMTQDYGSDPDFLENLKFLNTSIESLKDFIRVNLIKDPTVYSIKQI